MYTYIYYMRIYTYDVYIPLHNRFTRSRVEKGVYLNYLYIYIYHLYI